MEYFEGPHAAVHEIVGGDLGGYCPKDANEECFEAEPSPTFSANEPMFWLHHAVSTLPLILPLQGHYGLLTSPRWSIACGGCGRMPIQLTYMLSRAEVCRI